MTYEGEELPESLVAHYNKLHSAGRYMGTLAEFISVSYMVYRAEHKEAALSRKKWLKGLLEQEQK